MSKSALLTIGGNMRMVFGPSYLIGEVVSVREEVSLWPPPSSYSSIFPFVCCSISILSFDCHSPLLVSVELLHFNFFLLSYAPSPLKPHPETPLSLLVPQLSHHPRSPTTSLPLLLKKSRKSSEILLLVNGLQAERDFHQDQTT
jgi:hypothetical protein